jgi:hypothetical protein
MMHIQTIKKRSSKGPMPIHKANASNKSCYAKANNMHKVGHPNKKIQIKTEKHPMIMNFFM